MPFEPLYDDPGVLPLMVNSKAVIIAACADGAPARFGAAPDKPLHDFKSYQFSRRRETDIEVDLEKFPVCTIMPASEDPDSLTEDFATKQDDQLLIEISYIDADPDECTLQIIRYMAMVRQILFKSFISDPRVLLAGYAAKSGASIEITRVAYTVINTVGENSYLHTASMRVRVKFDQAHVPPA